MICPAETVFLQLRLFLKTTLEPKMILPAVSGLEKLLHEGNLPHPFSKMYSFLMYAAPKLGLHMSDFIVTTDLELWLELCQSNN